jgi:hypothetical protein
MDIGWHRRTIHVPMSGPTPPLRAYRVWMHEPPASNPLLYSLGRGAVWELGAWMYAECRRATFVPIPRRTAHPETPAVDCSCGVYAAKDVVCIAGTAAG